MSRFISAGVKVCLVAGRPPKPKPDEEWGRSELARLNAEAAYFRSLGTPEALAFAAQSERLAGELRASFPKRWRIGAKWEVWRQRARGVLLADSYRPREARRLALMIAVGSVSTLRSAPPAERAHFYAQAELACRDAAETCGNPHLTKSLDVIMREALEAFEYGDFPDGATWLHGWRDRGVDLMTVSRAAGVSLQTLLDLYGRPPPP